MVKPFLIVAMLLAGGHLAFAKDNPLRWPADAKDENDTRVLAWYQARCDSWASEQQLAGQSRNSYVEQCRKNAPQTWPVGLDPSTSDE
jgi:hypothetical protein